MMSPGETAPTEARRTPRTMTAAVASAPSASMNPEKRASIRVRCTPVRHRRSLPSRSRRSSKASAPAALIIGIAPSASEAKDAMSPSCARCCREVALSSRR